MLGFCTVQVIPSVFFLLGAGCRAEGCLGFRILGLRAGSVSLRLLAAFRTFRICLPISTAVMILIILVSLCVVLILTTFQFDYSPPFNICMLSDIDTLLLMFTLIPAHVITLLPPVIRPITPSTLGPKQRRQSSSP